jgi:hypothetical protein
VSISLYTCTLPRPLPQFLSTLSFVLFSLLPNPSSSFLIQPPSSTSDFLLITYLSIVLVSCWSKPKGNTSRSSQWFSYVTPGSDPISLSLPQYIIPTLDHYPFLTIHTHFHYPSIHLILPILPIPKTELTLTNQTGDLLSQSLHHHHHLTFPV